MGAITGISDLDAVRWPNSHWRSVKVGWDESTAGERQPRVSLWEIEPLTTFPMYPTPFPLRLKRPRPTGLPSLHGGKDDDLTSSLMWLRDSANPGFQSLNFSDAANATSVSAAVIPSKHQWGHDPGPAQSEFLQQQLQRCQSFNEKKPQLLQQQESNQQQSHRRNSN
ncbi:auxin response factor 17-like [Triticum dicoccoides]|uniref:auxin response factor 17-like n=1 Tax=Triticum dicoccoides TaxID=85692 RepID=UPI00188ED3C4|nr:auxin response factor 17-like [Triticum dicoccoides]